MRPIRGWAQDYPCAYCGERSRYRFPVPIEATCWDCWLKDHDDTRAFMFGHPWPRFHLFRTDDGLALRLLHGFVLRRHASKPPWAMRAEAVYWLARGDTRMARLFWRGARAEDTGSP